MILRNFRQNSKIGFGWNESNRIEGENVESAGSRGMTQNYSRICTTNRLDHLIQPILAAFSFP